MNEQEQKRFIDDKIRKWVAKYVADQLRLTESTESGISEIRFTPKSSSSGPEGTIYYDSDDNCIYVATEV